MKTKTKMIIALSLAGVIALGAVIALVVVIASFNATAGSGLSVSYVAKNVEAEVSMGYVVSEIGSDEPNNLTYTTVQAGSNEKLTFSSSDTAETVSKSFDNLPDIELTKDSYIYLKYTFKHTGTTANSQNYLNVTLNNTFSTLNNIKIEYMLYDPAVTDPAFTIARAWMVGINGLTITRDTDNECVLFARAYVDVKTQNALLDGSIVFSMTTSDTDYFANLTNGSQFSMAIKEAEWSGAIDTTIGSVKFDSVTDENLSLVSTAESTYQVQADGSGPITAYKVKNETTSLYDVYVLSGFEVYAIDCRNLFDWLTAMTTLEVGSLNTQYVTSMVGMFSGCDTLTSLDLSLFDSSNVTDMSSMFSNCGLSTLDLTPLDVSKVTNMYCMFGGMTKIESLDISSFDTSNVTDMSYMFMSNGAKSITLGSIDTSKVTTMQEMFQGCSSLTTIYISKNLSTESLKESFYMFVECTALVGGNGTACDGTNNVDATYARIDTAETPGYFTLKTA